MGAYDFSFDVPAGETLAPNPDRVGIHQQHAPAAFESALITLGKFTREGTTFRIADGHAALTAKVSCDGAALESATDTINQPPHPTRIALRCVGDVRAATIRVLVRPADAGKN